MSVVIVGAGQAGVQVADSLRAGGYTGDVTLVSAEECLPYQRPPLSKDYMIPGHEQEALPLRGGSYFEDERITLLSGRRVESIDRAAGTVRLCHGEELAFDHLVLATGLRARRLDVPGRDLPGVHTLRTLDDAEQLSARLSSARRVVVVGGGYIGLEFASAAREHGCEVHVLSTSAPLRRSVSAAMSEYVRASHEAAGTHVHVGVSASAFEAGADGRVASVVTTGGERLEADLVVVGIGASPDLELARNAGLSVADGVEVDEFLQTSDPRILAVGDCASFPSNHAGHRVRLESVQNATDQGRHVAAVILGRARPYADLPWFWSIQGKNKIQIAGLAAPDDDAVVLGDQASGKFSVARFHDGVLCAVESVNQPADHMAARTLLSSDAPVMRAEVVAPDFSLKLAAKAHKQAALAA